jgi:cytidyltransferase-like protein
VNRIYVGGTFDLFHRGHVELLRRASLEGEVWVALNSDEYVQKLKGNPPVMDYVERATVLLACKYVKDVVCNWGNESRLLELVKPQTIMYANDGSYTRASYLKLFALTEADLDSRGIVLLFPTYTKGVSSSDVVDRILSRHRPDGVQAPEHLPDHVPGHRGLDAAPGRVLDGVRDRGRCPCC